MCDEAEIDALRRIPILSPTKRATESSRNIEIMLELMQGVRDLGAFDPSVRKLTHLMTQFRAISAEATESGVDRLELEFFHLIRREPRLVHLHLLAFDWDVAQALRAHITDVEARQASGECSASEAARLPELQNNLSQLEAKMRRELDAFQKGH
jgi:hypothetical protein